MKSMKSVNMTLSAILTIGIAALGFAYEVYGSGYRGPLMGLGILGYGCGPAYGQGHMMEYYGSYDYGNLSREDATKLYDSHAKYFDETRELRKSILSKQFDLDDELQKVKPDRSRADDLQKKLSQLKSQLNQKTMDHKFAFRKQFPQNTYSRGGFCGL